MLSIKSGVKYIHQFSRNRIPGQVVIQITDRCNALCPQCGMRRSAGFPRTSLSGPTIRRILEGCAERHVQAVSFTGGEPMLLLDDLVAWIDYAGRLGIPFIRTGTNGFLFCGAHRPGFLERMQRLAERLAATPLRNLWISLDSSVAQVHERMRGLPGVVAGIEKALPVFHAAGLYPSANLGLNRLVGGDHTSGLRPQAFSHRQAYLEEFYRRYAQAFDRFYRFVDSLGFTTVNTCYPMSIGEQEQQEGLNAVYAASGIEDVVRFAADEKAMLYKALADTIPRHRTRLRIFSPLSSIYQLYQYYYAGGRETSAAAGCRGGVDFFFIDAVNGDTYPCGYRGNENLGKFWNLNLEALRPKDSCHRCDWECFRDPSELCAPFLEVLHAPVRLARKMTSDPLYRHLWLEDLRYYHHCDFFDGRRPSNLTRLNRFFRPCSSKTITALTPA